MRTVPASEPPRRRLLDAAAYLFYRSGIHAVGVDAIVRRAGVAKASLYAHFGTKDALVEAYLLERDRQFRAWLDDRVRALARTPERRILAVFDALGEWFRTDDFRGCAFANASAEYPDLAHPVRLAARKHKAALRAYLRALVVAAGLARPERLSGDLMVLVEDDRTAARVARALAARLIAP